MFWLVLISSEGNLKLLHRWPWRLVRPWMPGMEHEAGRWSTLLEQCRRDGSADRTTRRKEASIWASTAPPTLSFPWRSLNPLALLSHPLQCKHLQKVLLPSPWLRQIRPPPPLLVLLLMLPWLPREAKLSDIPPRRVRSSGMISGWSEGFHFVLFRSARLGSCFFNNRQKAAVTPAERFGLWIPGAGKKPLKWAWERREMHNCNWIRSIVHCCSWWNHKSLYWTGIKWMLLKAKSIFLYYCVNIILFCMSVFLKNKTKTFPLLETVVCLLIVKEIWYFVSSVPSSSLLSFPVF